MVELRKTVALVQADNEENELSTFVKDCASIGCGKARKEVMGIVEMHAKDKGLLSKDSITQGWWHI